MCFDFNKVAFISAFEAYSRHCYRSYTPADNWKRFIAGSRTASPEQMLAKMVWQGIRAAHDDHLVTLEFDPPGETT